PPVFVTGRTTNGGSPPPGSRSTASAWATARRCSWSERPCGSRFTTATSAEDGTSNACADRLAAVIAAACSWTSETRSAGPDVGHLAPGGMDDPLAERVEHIGMLVPLEVEGGGDPQAVVRAHTLVEAAQKGDQGQARITAGTGILRQSHLADRRRHHLGLGRV